MNDLVGLDKSTGELREDIDIYQKGEFDKAVNEAVEKIISEYKIEDTERRKEIHEFLKSKDKSYSDDKFIKCMDEEILKILPLLNINEAGTVMRLLAHLSINEGQLKDSNGYLHMDKIIRIIGKSEKTVKTYINNLVAHGILAKAGKYKRKDVYAFNPSIHCRKGGTKGYFTKIWLSNLRDEWSSLPLDTLGFLYRTLPYFNTYSYCLSANPYEYDVAESLPFTMNALSEIIHMNIEDVRKHVNILSDNGLMLRIEVGASSVLCVNPQVMYRSPVNKGENVAGDIGLLFKQKKHISDSKSEILEKRRLLRKSS